jgi:hypothetical protein
MLTAVRRVLVAPTSDGCARERISVMNITLPRSPWIAAVLIAILTLGTSYRTIVIDGTNDFAADEAFAASSAGATWYFTWDANYLYIGASNPDISAGSASKWVLCYFDTDPQLVPTEGTGTRFGQTYNTQQPQLPFTANYHFRWKSDDTFTDLQTFNGSTWQSADQTGIQHSRSVNFLEIRIPRANLGSPGRIYACADMINEQGGSEWTYFLAPSLHTDGYDVNVTHYFGFVLDNGIAPNDGANLDAPLPIQLKSFSASLLTSGQVRLDWTTLSETNNYGFEVEKSTARESGFRKISPLIPGHQTTVTPNSYAYLDDSNTPGRFYRLKQIDLDHSARFSEAIEVGATDVAGELPLRFDLGQNYPNPFNPATRIDFALKRSEFVTLKVYDFLGREVAVLVNEIRPAGAYSVPFFANGLASGVYVYRLQAGTLSLSRTMTVIK